MMTQKQMHWEKQVLILVLAGLIILGLGSAVQPVASQAVSETPSDEEAIQIANDTEYGLSAGVMTRDEGRGLAIVNRLDTGNCHINCSSVNDEPHVPFGGFKASGIGREFGKEGLEHYVELKSIVPQG